MAKNKKSFILYSDQREVFDKLSDEQAGQLVKHIFSYVNDENPKADFIIDLAFSTIKTQLKRDLFKWYNQKKQRSEAGKRSAEVRRLAKQTKEEKQKKVINNFDFKKELLNLGADKYLVNDWLTVRKKKKASNTKTAFNSFIKQVKISGLNLNEVLNLCASSSWVGFNAEWIKKENKKTDKIKF